MKCSYGNRSYSTVDVERANYSSVLPINKSRNVCSLVYCKLLNLLLFWIFCVPCFLEQSLGETSRPLNRAALNGNRVQLNCSTLETGNGYWEYTKPFDSYVNNIYDGVKVINGMTTIFSVNDSVQGIFNLIFNASESTSGRYTCRPDINTDDQSAEMIVLDSEPICSMIATSDIFVNVSCVIEFNGNWAPKIQWHNMNGRIEINDTTTVQNNRVTSFLIVPANQTDILTCTPTFVLENKPHETRATNVPYLVTNCTLTIGSSHASSTQSTTTTTSSPPYYIIGIASICVCAIATTVIVVFHCYRKKCRPTKSCRYKDPFEDKPMAVLNEV